MPGFDGVGAARLGVGSTSEGVGVGLPVPFVFVGAGYAGVEALAELADLVHDAARYYPELEGAEQHWVLVDAAPKILPEIPTKLGDYAARELARRGVDIRVSTTLEEAGPGTARRHRGRPPPRDGIPRERAHKLSRWPCTART